MLKVECPQCKAAFDVEPVVTVPENQRVWVTLKRESPGGFAALDVASIIKSASIVFSETAKAIGFKVVVVIEDVKVEPQEIRICLGILRVKGSKRKKPEEAGT